MNMCYTCGIIVKLVVLVILLQKMCFQNNIGVHIWEGCGHSHHTYRHNAFTLNTKQPTIACGPTALKAIGYQSNHDKRNLIMPFGTIRWIRDLRLNCKYSKTKPRSRKEFHQQGINFNNLIQVEVNYKDGYIHDTQVTMATINIRWVRNKEQLLLRELNKDIAIVCETWVRDEIDDVWIDSSDLNKELYSCYTANRQNGTGGGLMLTCKSNYKVKEIQKGYTRSFEYATLSVAINNRSVTVMGIYHPPPKLNITNGMFIDDITV